MFLLLSGIITAQKNDLQIAITIDDLPLSFGNDVSEEMQDSIIIKVLETLDKYNITASGFVIGTLVDSTNVKYIEQFADAGHLVGNHTHSHYDFNRVSAKKYIEDIKIADSIICEILPEYRCDKVKKIRAFDDYVAVKVSKNKYLVYPGLDKNLDEQEVIKSEKIPKHRKLFYDNKYMRYPFLHYGDTQAKKDSVLNFLKDFGYKIAYSSVTSNDWSFHKRCVDAFNRGDWERIEKIGKQYVENVIRETNSSLEYTYQRVGRNIKHILITHMNLLNALFLDDVLKWYKENGWEFITLQEALSDEVYEWEDIYVGKIGIPLPFHVSRPKSQTPKSDSLKSE
jgi:peptidoglycan/xylan/chitin deacetylase (PgdA/CDA1 family)